MFLLGKNLLVWRGGAFLLLSVALLQGQSKQPITGAQACAKCHAAIHQQWAASFHAKMLQPATDLNVKGNFVATKVVLRGSTYLLQHRAARFYVTESDLKGTAWEHRVEYTLGDRRIQQYLTTLPDGRIIVLPPTWDLIRKTWMHDVDSGNPEEDPGSVLQVWNKSCYTCHVTRAEKNFDVRQLRYQTTWQDSGISCESCHGLGADHVQAATAAGTDANKRALVNSKIVNPAHLDATRSSMLCAQCHSFRDIDAVGFTAGADYYDFFVPLLEARLPSSENLAYWPDARPRWLANEAIAFWQSQCFLKGGATCSTCHPQPHNIDVKLNPQLRPDNNALCTNCHTAIAKGIAKHTHHAANTPGSSCIECHMPATVVSLNTRMRDHSLSIPVPENTIRHDISNACNLCHRDKSPAWAERQVKSWYGDKRRQVLIARADAFSQARQGNAAAVPGLLQILSDSSQGEFIRANAAEYLGSFPNDPAAYDAVLQAMSDPQPLVRGTAALAIRPRAAQRAAVAPVLVSLLADPAATVRLNAAIALVAMGVLQLPGEDGLRFDRAMQLYRSRAELNSDDAQQQFAAGRFFLLSGNMDSAVVAFRASLKLDDKTPARYYLGRALAQKGDVESARQILQTVPTNDLQYELAQRLLADLETKELPAETAAQQGAATESGAAADEHFRDGQLQYQNKDYGAAVTQLEQALHLAPQATWAKTAEIDRAISLEKLGRASEAEAAINALSGSDTTGDVDLQLAYVELLYDAGRREEALQRVDQLIAVAAQAPTAYFWRAKVLLQLQRTHEAAKAAEESIRLQPNLPEAHSLLLRIYQMQGRTPEAGEQAQWLSDYQRRMESR